MLLASPDQPIEQDQPLRTKKRVIHQIAPDGKTHLNFCYESEKKKVTANQVDQIYHSGVLPEGFKNSKFAVDGPDGGATANPKVWRLWPNFGKEKPPWVRRKHFNACLLNETKAYTTKSPSEPVPRNREEALNPDYWPQYYQAECAWKGKRLALEVTSHFVSQQLN